MNPIYESSMDEKCVHYNDDVRNVTMSFLSWEDYPEMGTANKESDFCCWSEYEIEVKVAVVIGQQQ